MSRTQPQWTEIEEFGKLAKQIIVQRPTALPRLVPSGSWHTGRTSLRGVPTVDPIRCSAELSRRRLHVRPRTS